MILPASPRDLVRLDGNALARLSVKQFSKLYDEFYDEIDKLLKKYNPCEIKDGACIENREGYTHNKSGCCCQRCPYVGKNGCRVKCLGCKAGLCPFVRRRGCSKELIGELNKIRLDIPVYMSSIRISKKSIVNAFKAYKRRGAILSTQKLIPYSYW